MSAAQKAAEALRLISSLRGKTLLGNGTHEEGAFAAFNQAGDIAAEALAALEADAAHVPPDREVLARRLDEQADYIVGTCDEPVDVAAALMREAAAALRIPAGDGWRTISDDWSICNKQFLVWLPFNPSEHSAAWQSGQRGIICIGIYDGYDNKWHTDDDEIIIPTMYRELPASPSPETEEARGDP